MTESFDVEVFDAWKGIYVDATLIKDAPVSEIDAAAAGWDTWLGHTDKFYKRYGISPAVAAPHSHWPWAKFATAIAASGGAAEMYSVITEQTVQGMMVLITAGWDCRLPAQKGYAGAYVELIGSAPWNQRTAVPVPRYLGVGSALMQRAVTVSKDEGMKGRLGLHALSGASSWYAKIGMVSLGPDPDPKKQNLEYFEFTATAAEAYLS